MICTSQIVDSKVPAGSKDLEGSYSPSQSIKGINPKAFEQPIYDGLPKSLNRDMVCTGDFDLINPYVLIDLMKTCSPSFISREKGVL